MMDPDQKDGPWDVVIRPHAKWWRPDVKELWNFRDLLVLFVRRDLLAVYKQTILGPLWQVVQPVLTSVMFAVIFGGAQALDLAGGLVAHVDGFVGAQLAAGDGAAAFGDQHEDAAAQQAAAAADGLADEEGDGGPDEVGFGVAWLHGRLLRVALETA